LFLVRNEKKETSLDGARARMREEEANIEIAKRSYARKGKGFDTVTLTAGGGRGREELYLYSKSRKTRHIISSPLEGGGLRRNALSSEGRERGKKEGTWGKEARRVLMRERRKKPLRG